MSTITYFGARCGWGWVAPKVPDTKDGWAVVTEAGPMSGFGSGRDICALVCVGVPKAGSLGAPIVPVFLLASAAQENAFGSAKSKDEKLMHTAIKSHLKRCVKCNDYPQCGLIKINNNNTCIYEKRANFTTKYPMWLLTKQCNSITKAEDNREVVYFYIYTSLLS